jgi:hypothetical protein
MALALRLGRRPHERVAPVKLRRPQLLRWLVTC